MCLPPRGCERQPLHLLHVLLHLRGGGTEGAKGEQLEGVNTVLVHPFNPSKGRREADAEEWS